MPETNHAVAIADILAIISENQTFLVTSHARPDGDAIGSSLGLTHMLEAMGKRVVCAFNDPVPVIFHTLPGANRIVHTLPSNPPDVAIILECDTIARTGFKRIPAHFTLNIDHHLSGKNFANYNWIDPDASAVGAMIHEIAVSAGCPITPAMATCLYTALITDTGAFTYPATNAATFGLAEHLILCGADSAHVADSVYFSYSPGKMRLLGIALNRMQIEGPIAWSSVTLDDMDYAGADVEDCEGVANYLIAMAGIRASVFLREIPGGRHFRVSMRSKGRVDVAAVATAFGGGGHRNASGGDIYGTLAEATNHLLNGLQAACDVVQPLLSTR